MTVDPTKPNVGRIYDYLLGGHHNFEADRAAAQKLMTILPSAPQWAKINRWFMHAALERFVEVGINRFIDLATGLPTQGYIHEWEIEDALMVYNDHDPVIVAYAREILGENPSVHFTQTDLRQIDVILNEAESFFGGRPRCGICIIGVAYLIDDESLVRVMQRLYDWAAPGSELAISCFDEGVGRGVVDLYASMGTKLYPRPKERFDSIMGRWTLQVPGMRPLREYAEQLTQTKIDHEQLGGLDFFYGGVFKKD